MSTGNSRNSSCSGGGFDRHSDSRIVVGATDLGLDITKKKKVFPNLISLESIAELQGIDDQGDSWRIGAATTLAELEEFSQSNWPSMARMLRYFGARQIKNRATLGGNVCNASPDNIAIASPYFMWLESLPLLILSLSIDGKSS